MKKIIALIISLFLMNTVYSQQLLDGVAAIVDDDIILESEVLQTTMSMMMQMGYDLRKDADKFEELKKQSLTSLINQKLILIQAEKDTILADEQQVESMLEQEMGNIVQRIGGEDKLQEYVGMPLSRYRRIKRQEVENYVRGQNVQQQLFATATVTRREIQQFFETMKDSIGNVPETIDISHILVTPTAGEKTKAKLKTKLKEIRQQIVSGEKTFDEMAKEHSQDPGSAVRGGDLGFMSRDDLVTPYAEAALQLEEGKISDIVESQYGYHIIRLNEKRGDKIHTHHILLSFTPEQEDLVDAANKIKDVYQQLLDGADFGDMVEKYSTDETTNKIKGHLGVYEVEQLEGIAKEFVWAIRGVDEGGFSEPFNTKYGNHIVLLNSRNEARELSVEEDRERLEMMTLEHKKSKLFKEWLEDIKKEIYIEIKAD